MFDKLHPLFLIILLMITFTTTNLTAQENPIKIADDLELFRLTENCYHYICYVDLQSMKHVPHNGLIYFVNDQALLIDTPWNDDQTRRLLLWLKDSLQIKITGVISTHWHADCMGGLGEIQRQGIDSWSHKLTQEIASAKNLPVPKTGFQDSLRLELCGKSVICKYPGGGHTIDNIVVWLPEEKILFGGCLVKSLEATNLGFTGDAVLSDWPASLKHLPEWFPDAKVVVPGHGRLGDLKLVHHTLSLISK